MTETLRDLRIATRFSLWMWAVYWPGGGLLLLAAGMTDPVSIILLGILLAGFALVLASGAVAPTGSRTMRQFLVERPLYVIGGAVVLVIASSAFEPLQNIGLSLFAGLYLSSIVLVGIRMAYHMRETRTTLRSGPDQVFIALALTGTAAALVLLDALLPLFGAPTTPATSHTVAAFNWINIAYPPLLLLAARPYREPLRNPFRRRAPATPPAPAADAGDKAVL